MLKHICLFCNVGFLGSCRLHPIILIPQFHMSFVIRNWYLLKKKGKMSTSFLANLLNKTAKLILVTRLKMNNSIDQRESTKQTVNFNSFRNKNAGHIAKKINCYVII